jgi:hypothetical protein
MKQFRNNVFETNSSSTHSISIARGDNSSLTELPSLDEEGNLIVDCGEYGWEIQSYHGVEDRINYAATYALNYRDTNLLTEVLKEYTGANEIIYPEDNGGWSDTGYIDHQSTEVASEIFESEENLKHFLFNPKSFFMTDNDNH